MATPQRSAAPTQQDAQASLVVAASPSLQCEKLKKKVVSTRKQAVESGSPLPRKGAFVAETPATSVNTSGQKHNQNNGSHGRATRQLRQHHKSVLDSHHEDKLPGRRSLPASDNQKPSKRIPAMQNSVDVLAVECQQYHTGEPDQGGAQITQDVLRHSSRNPIASNSTKCFPPCKESAKPAVSEECDMRPPAAVAYCNIMIQDGGECEVKCKMDAAEPAGSNSGESSTIIDYMGDPVVLQGNADRIASQAAGRLQAPQKADIAYCNQQGLVIGTVYYCQNVSPDPSPPLLNENSSQCLQAVSRMIAAHNKNPGLSSGETLISKRQRCLNFDLEADDEDDSMASAGGNRRRKKRKLKQNWSLISQESVGKLLSSSSDGAFPGFNIKQPEPKQKMTYDEVSEVELSDNSEREWLLPSNVVERDSAERKKLRVSDAVLQQPLFGQSEPSSEWDKTLGSYLEEQWQRKSKESSLSISLAASDAAKLDANFIKLSHHPNPHPQCQRPPQTNRLHTMY